jgi:hypothetical protein
VITHYRSASKGLTPIKAMHDEHLARAIANPAPGNDALTLAALKAEQARRAGNPADTKGPKMVSAASAYSRVFG